MSRILIVGAGLAGLSAAISLAEQGRKSCLISLQPSERAQSVLAEGGINGALDLMGEQDSPGEHFRDTMRGGCDLADPDAVAAMTEAAPEIIRSLEALGVPFNREKGRIIQRNFGGQKKKRTAFAKSSTGKILMSALIDAARRYEAAGFIRRYPHHQLTDLLVEEAVCRGLRIQDSYTGQVLELSGPVLLCTGGLNGLFPGMTTGTTANTGDASAIAFLKGAAMGNLEFIQYHPTTVQIAGKRLLVSEAARGEGGRLYVNQNSRRCYFMEERYPELGNLMPRDVISREMVSVCTEPGTEPQVYLDLTGLPDDTWEKKLPDLRTQLIHYLALDPRTEPIPVSPGIHFFMGGIYVNQNHRTTIQNLWAAGECACQYHGANRLGGNSMLGAIYGGRVAACDLLQTVPDSGEDLEPVQVSGAAAASLPSPVFCSRLCEILCRGLGIYREQASMEQALQDLEALSASGEGEQRRRLLGKAMLISALERRESRGAHTRLDCPDRDDRSFRKTTLAVLQGDKIAVSFRPIPKGGFHGAED